MKMRLFFTLFILLGGFLMTGQVRAEIEEVTLRVDGLACPFCAYGLEKKMMPIKGVKSYDVDMGEGKVYLGLDKDAKLDLEAFRKGVKEAGFTLRDVHLRAKGTIEKTREGFSLVLAPGGDQLLLFEKEATGKEYHQGDDPKNLVVGRDLAGKLEEHARTKAEVRVEGSVHEHQGLPAGLAIDKLEDVG